VSILTNSGHYYGISLQIRGGTLDPDALSELLAEAPEYWARKGERRQSKSSTPIIPKEHYWSFAFDGETIDEQFNRVFTLLRTKEPQLRTILQAEGRLALYVFVSPVGSLGFEIAVEQLALLSSLNVSLGIETHCPRVSQS
jgi:Domain of unknown function (DUF4279)